MHYPFLPEEHIEASALALISRAFGDADAAGCCVDLDALLFDYLYEKDDLVFADEEDLGTNDGEKVLGRTLPFAGRVEICRSLKHSGNPGRYRFTVGHELGHWILHRPLFLAGRNQLELGFGNEAANEALVSVDGNIFSTPQQKVPREEYQANRFAVALLVNGKLLRGEFEKRFGQPPMICPPGDLRLSSRRIARERRNGLQPLHQTFGLSVEAMAISLESKGYLADQPTILYSP